MNTRQRDSSSILTHENRFTRASLDKQQKPITLGQVFHLCAVLHQQLNDATTSHEFTWIPSSFRLFTQRIQQTLQMDPIPPGFRNIKCNQHQLQKTHEESITTNLLEEGIISMASWLYANNIITSLKEYLVPVSTLTKKSRAEEMKLEQSDEKGEQLFQQVMKSNYLDSGTISNMALAWRCGWNHSSLISFQHYVLTNKNFLLVTRSHCHGDDWGSP
jgi:hypothetical protein